MADFPLLEHGSTVRERAGKTPIKPWEDPSIQQEVLELNIRLGANTLMHISAVFLVAKCASYVLLMVSDEEDKHCQGALQHRPHPLFLWFVRSAECALFAGSLAVLHRSIKSSSLCLYMGTVLVWTVYILFCTVPPLHRSCAEIEELEKCRRAEFKPIHTQDEHSWACLGQSHLLLHLALAWVMLSPRFIPQRAMMRKLSWIWIWAAYTPFALVEGFSHQYRDLILLNIANLCALKCKKVIEKGLCRRFYYDRECRQEEKEKFEILKRLTAEQVIVPMLQNPFHNRAEQIDRASVLFIRFEGFREKVQRFSGEPEKVLDFLHDSFNKFDAICAHYEVMKVETIGEEYVAAVGITPSDAHIERKKGHEHILDRLIRAAAAILELADKSEPKEDMALKMGIHTGPIVAGVVGQKLPRFRLFGDTVNTASRMMSTGLARNLQFGEETKSHLPAWVQVTPRGKTWMKGKGELTTYFLKRTLSVGLCVPSPTKARYSLTSRLLKAQSRTADIIRTFGPEQSSAVQRRFSFMVTPSERSFGSSYHHLTASPGKWRRETKDPSHDATWSPASALKCDQRTSQQRTRSGSRSRAQSGRKVEIELPIWSSSADESHEIPEVLRCCSYDGSLGQCSLRRATGIDEGTEVCISEGSDDGSPCRRRRNSEPTMSTASLLEPPCHSSMLQRRASWQWPSVHSSRLALGSLPVKSACSSTVVGDARPGADTPQLPSTLARSADLAKLVARMPCESAAPDRKDSTANAASLARGANICSAAGSQGGALLNCRTNTTVPSSTSASLRFPSEPASGSRTRASLATIRATSSEFSLRRGSATSAPPCAGVRGKSEDLRDSEWNGSLRRQTAEVYCDCAPDARHSEVSLPELAVSSSRSLPSPLASRQKDTSEFEAPHILTSLLLSSSSSSSSSSARPRATTESFPSTPPAVQRRLSAASGSRRAASMNTDMFADVDAEMRGLNSARATLKIVDAAPARSCAVAGTDSGQDAFFEKDSVRSDRIRRHTVAPFVSKPEFEQTLHEVTSMGHSGMSRCGVCPSSLHTEPDLECEFLLWFHGDVVMKKIVGRLDRQALCLSALTMLEMAYTVFYSEAFALRHETYEHMRLPVFVFTRLAAFSILMCWRAVVSLPRAWIWASPTQVQRRMVASYLVIAVLMCISYEAISVCIDSCIYEDPKDASGDHQEWCQEAALMERRQEAWRRTHNFSFVYAFVFYIISSQTLFLFLPSCTFIILAVVLMWMMISQSAFEAPVRLYGFFFTPMTAGIFIGTSILNSIICKNREEFQRDMFRAKVQYEEWNGRITYILNASMPPLVVQQLTHTPNPSHHYKQATIVQSDFCGFTQLASRIHPGDVVLMMSQIFGRFDALADKHKVYKVETVGDMYIAGQAEEPLTPKHHYNPMSVVWLALDMVRATHEWSRETGETITCRVGVHYGAVIGGIVGTEMQRYHLFGEFMTVLDILESTAPEGKVQISQALANAAEDALEKQDIKLEVSMFEQRIEDQLTTSKGEVHEFSEVGGRTFIVRNYARQHFQQ